MIDYGWQRLDGVARRTLPLASLFIAALLGVIVMPLPYYGAVSPLFMFIAVFFWAVYRPDLVRPAGVFLAGLLHDCIHDYPFGSSALVFVGLYQITVVQRHFLVNLDFRFIWFGFALAVSMYALGMWSLMCLINTQWISPTPLIIQALLTIALYPVPVLVLLALHKLAMSPS